MAAFLRKKLKLYAIALCCVCVAVIGLCTRQNPYAGGGGTETVVGALISEDGSSAAQTSVELLPADYDPLLPDTLRYNYVAIANESGGYCFKNVPIGEYTLLATLPGKKTKAIKSGIFVAKGNMPGLLDTLRSTGTVLVTLPGDIGFQNGYVYVPGTNIAVSFGVNNGSVTLDSVPAGELPAIVYRSINGSDRQVIRYRVQVSSTDTTDVKNPAWHYARRLYFNTTASGANVNNAVMDFPVLVRLTKDNMNFAEAAADGKDIRFRKSNDTSLLYEIERWDSVNQVAEVWVRVDTILGNDSLQSIMMYWGNSNTTSQSDPASVFDTTLGFAGVWHLAETDSLAADATGNHYNGTGYFTTPVAGMIGKAQHFNGVSSFIRMKGTAQSKLNFPMNGHYMVSAWICHDTLADSVTYLIAGKGDLQYFIKNFDLGLSTTQHERQWEFTEYHGNNIWQAVTFVPASAKTWTYLVGIRDGSNQYLYVNGAIAMSGYRVIGTGQDTIARDTTDDFTIGAFLHSVADWNQGYAYFNGSIDEVNVSSLPRSADWIKLCYMNQKAEDKLIVFDK